MLKKMILRNIIIFLSFVFSINAFVLIGCSKCCQQNKCCQHSGYQKCCQQRAEMIKYLKKYDYITAEQLKSPVCWKYLKDAIRRFQDLVGLDPTGQINPQTFEEIGKPRCGRSDVHSIREHDVIPWKNQIITYSVVTNSRRFCHADLKRTMREVFNAWSDYIPRQFIEVNTESAANIKIRFGRLDHGDGADFDGPGGIFAHARSVGILHFDDDDLFKRYAQAEAITNLSLKDIYWVALHEAGHVLGIDHLPDYPSIMAAIYPSISMDSQGKYIVPNLQDAEVKRVQEIYGGKMRPKNDTITTIANGSPYTAYGIVQNDPELLQNITSEFFQAAQQSRWNMPQIPRHIEFTEIVSGAFKAFNPAATYNEMVYTTIFTHDIATGKIMKIVDAYEIISNKGVVIGADNQLKNVLIDKIWIDENGIDHTPRNCCAVKKLKISYDYE